MITSFIEIVELASFGHMNTSTIQSESRDKILLMTFMDKNYEVIILILKHLYFKKT